MSRRFDPQFTGANLQFLKAPPSPVYDNMTAFTLSMWVKLLGLGTVRGVYGSGTLAAKNIGFQTSKLLRVYAGSPDTGAAQTVHFTAEHTPGPAAYIIEQDIPPNTWTHIAITWQVGDYPKFFSNGHREIKSYYAHGIGGGTPWQDASGGWIFGSTGPTVVESFQNVINGQLAEIALFNTVISDARIADLYHVGGISNRTNLVGYWPLAGTASPEPDLSGNGNHAVLSANPPTPAEAPPVSGAPAPPPVPTPVPPPVPVPVPAPTPAPTPEPPHVEPYSDFLQFFINVSRLRKLCRILPDDHPQVVSLRAAISAALAAEPEYADFLDGGCCLHNQSSH